MNVFKIVMLGHLDRILGLIFLLTLLAASDADYGFAQSDKTLYGLIDPKLDRQQQPVVRDETWEKFKKDPDYVECYDPEVTALPQLQVEFVRNMTTKDMELYKEIVVEAIEKRNSMAPSMKLMWKYSKKILGNFITNRRKEKKLDPRVEPKASFFGYLAKLVETIIDKSAEVMKSAPYTKRNVDVDAMKAQIYNIFDTISRVTNKSPVAGYLKWSELRIYKNSSEPVNLTEEAAAAAAVSIGRLIDSFLD